MTQAQLQILEFFRQLAPAEQRELLAPLGETASGIEGVTAGRLAMLDEGVALAERGDTLWTEEAVSRPSNYSRGR